MQLKRQDRGSRTKRCGWSPGHVYNFLCHVDFVVALYLSFNSFEPGSQDWDTARSEVPSVFVDPATEENSPVTFKSLSLSLSCTYYACVYSHSASVERGAQVTPPDDIVAGANSCNCMNQLFNERVHRPG